MNIRITAPDRVLPSAWPMARAIFERIEGGSGSHCLEELYDETGAATGWRHHRLGVTIVVEEEDA